MELGAIGAKDKRLYHRNQRKSSKRGLKIATKALERFPLKTFSRKLVTFSLAVKTLSIDVKFSLTATNFPWLTCENDKWQQNENFVWTQMHLFQIWFWDGTQSYYKVVPIWIYIFDWKHELWVKLQSLSPVSISFSFKIKSWFSIFGWNQNWSERSAKVVSQVTRCKVWVQKEFQALGLSKEKQQQNQQEKA